MFSLWSKNLIFFQFVFFILICQLRVFLISLYFLGWEGGRKLLSLSLTSSSFYEFYKSQFLFHSDFSEEVEFSMRNLENQGSSMQIRQLEKKMATNRKKNVFEFSEISKSFEIWLDYVFIALLFFELFFRCNHPTFLREQKFFCIF